MSILICSRKITDKGKKNTFKMQYHILISALLMMVQPPPGLLIPQLILVYLIPFLLLNLELKFKNLTRQICLNLNNHVQGIFLMKSLKLIKILSKVHRKYN